MGSPGSLTLFTLSLEADGRLYEDKDIFQPDGIDIAYIISNFQRDYHPDYEHCRIKEKVKKSNKGRPKKIVKRKTTKRNNGDNSHFSCNITFGVIIESEVYTVKISRIYSGNISSVKYNDPELIERIANKAIAFINKNKPSVNMRLKKIELCLRNGRKRFPLDECQVINVNKLANELRPINSRLFCDEICQTKLVYNNTETSLTFIVIDPKGKIYKTTIDPKGDIYTFGGNNDRMVNEIIGMMEELCAKFVQIGYAKKKKKET